MSVYQNQNQVAQGPIKGGLSAVPNPATISCQVTLASSSTLYGGTAVTLVDGTANTILVDKASATQPIFGFVVLNPKKPSHAAGGKVEVALAGSVMEMEAAAAFSRQLVRVLIREVVTYSSSSSSSSCRSSSSSSAY